LRSASAGGRGTPESFKVRLTARGVPIILKAKSTKDGRAVLAVVKKGPITIENKREEEF
jgi:hypothetical protein